MVLLRKPLFEMWRVGRQVDISNAGLLKAKRAAPVFDIIRELLPVSHGFVRAGGLRDVYSSADSQLWLVFAAFFVPILAIDLFIGGGRKSGVLSVRAAFGWTLVWVVCALAFCGFLWLHVSA